jgi:tetratricopeptide (TPR) repeat protein
MGQICRGALARAAFAARTAGLLSILTVCLLEPEMVRAEGAIAVGSSGNIAKDGLAFSGVANKSTKQEAIDITVKACRQYSGAPRAAVLCKSVATFAEQCFAIAEDPKGGTPGAGWATGVDFATATKKALDLCRSTAGPSRSAFCELEGADCDFKDIEKRLTAADEYVRAAPNNFDSWRVRGNVYYVKGDYDHAIADYNQAIQRNPNSAVSLFWRGKSEQKKGDSAGGDADIAAANKIDPTVGD